MVKLNKNIVLVRAREHKKADEKYIDVIFNYKNKVWEGAVTIKDRRNRLDLTTESEIIEWINQVYEYLNPINEEKWLEEQEKFWNKSNKEVTREFFEIAKDGEWKCVKCDLPENPNWAKRWQDIKELGYVTSTNTKKYCERCGRNRTHVILLQIPRGFETGYETWTPKLRRRIMKTLKNYDVYEERPNNNLIIDHKFSEIRWDENTREENKDDMSEEEIKSKFQLILNQRNQQKREVCRTCVQTKKRGYPYGIKFYYEGDENWPSNIPEKGKSAEEGCIGCGWYDLAKWKEELNKKISN